ncbi:MAG: ATP-dependent acyl-CoA ligase [Actinobacteria bacterium]|nr:ATP-dependent acyl-CoA ligase [Actinomycetota bacterium]
MPAAPDFNLLRGQGLPLGPYVEAYPPEDRVMLRILSHRARERPEKDWVVFDSTDRLTFGAAWRDACRVGHALDRDVDPGAHVGLIMRNQPEFLTTLYGAQVRGGISVPLNADSKGPLLHAVVEHSDIQAIVVRTDLLDRLAELKDLAYTRVVVAVGEGAVPAAISGVRVVRWNDWLDGVRDDHAWPFPTSDRPCHIQYTSGTTARAKGAVYPHAFLYMYSGLCTDSQGRTEDDVLTAPLPLFHVAALHIIANSSLHAGCTGHLKSRFSASQYWQQVANDGATWGILLGPMATMILKATKAPVPEHRLTRMFCPPPPPEWQEFERRFAPVRIIWWGYGMTEIYSLPMIDPERQDRSLPMDTIGMPPQWIDYGVVDESDRLVPPDTVGELVFRPRIPHSMVAEYYKDYDKTVDAFRNLMFHTGDMATYDEAGLLHYRGRKQERIRRRGENIAAPEVEYVALTHPLIVDAAAFGVPAEIGEEEVKLDVVLSEPAAVEEIHAWLAESLPRYMVPRYLEIRESFPKTPSERVEKYKLKAEPLDRPAVFDAEGAPGR